MSQPTTPSSRAIAEAIFTFNAGRDPDLLAMKYAKMAKSPFAFLRGACHLFYDTLPDLPLLRDAPLAWSCGDLHFENFGSYKADNRLVYFDISDFDEAALAPAAWDMIRLLTSIQCGADVLHAMPAETLAINQSCLHAYRSALLGGKPLWVERETSSGLVNTLLSELQERQRSAFLDKRTLRDGRRRHLKLDGVKALPASEAQKTMVAEFMSRFAAAQADPDFFQVLDIGCRIAGTGSLGLERYVVLVAGKGSPDSNYLLDLKQAMPSALLPHLSGLGIKQPVWEDEAARVVTIQKRMQVVDHALLHSVKLDGRSFILKGLQASEDRVSIGDWEKNPDSLKALAGTLGSILAWDQLRASGRSGAASADDLIAWAQGDGWERDMLAAAAEMTRETQRQWEDFCRDLPAV